MSDPDRILVHGLFLQAGQRPGRLRASRETAFAERGGALGVHAHEWLDGAGQGRKLANRMLAKMRGTAPAVDAVEIIALNREALRSSLAREGGRKLWRELATGEARGIDPLRSFVMMGTPIQQLDGPARGQRVIWFGNGLGQLSRQEFIAHYTTRHGPLVAGNADLIGLRCYRQVPDESDPLCAQLRELGMGRAAPPAVFGELYMGAPVLGLSARKARRAAAGDIAADEKRHIDFSRSMLFLPGR